MHRLALILFLLISMKAFATMPVIDNVAIGNIILMLEELEAQYEQMQLHLAETQKHTNILSGKNAFSDIHNTVADKQAREWAPDSIESFEDMIASGFNPGDLADRYAYYQAKFPALSYEHIEPKNPNSAQRDLYAYNEEWTKMNLTSFAQTFDTVNHSYARINSLLSEANKHDTLKESSDFGNRLLGELAYLLQHLIQVQNFEMHVNTMLQQADQNYIASHAEFFTFKKK